MNTTRGERLDFSSLPDVSETNPELTHPAEVAYASQMAAREQFLHAVFGTPEPEGSIWSPSDPNLTVNWAGGGFYMYPAASGSCYFVTSGLAQPVDDQPGESDDPEAFSGLGIELVMQAPADSRWTFGVLESLVRYMLFQENAQIIMPGDRIPCGGPIVTDTDTELCYLIGTFSDQYNVHGRLPAGDVDLVHLTAVTQAEADRAIGWGKGTGGTLILADALGRLGIDEMSDPERTCATLRDDFDSTWDQAQAELESVWRQNGWDG